VESVIKAHVVIQRLKSLLKNMEGHLQNIRWLAIPAILRLQQKLPNGLMLTNGKTQVVTLRELVTNQGNK
jgi:hypothetical protein